MVGLETPRIREVGEDTVLLKVPVVRSFPWVFRVHVQAKNCHLNFQISNGCTEKKLIRQLKDLTPNYHDRTKKVAVSVLPGTMPKEYEIPRTAVERFPDNIEALVVNGACLQSYKSLKRFPALKHLTLKEGSISSAEDASTTFSWDLVDHWKTLESIRLDHTHFGVVANLHHLLVYSPLQHLKIVHPRIQFENFIFSAPAKCNWAATLKTVHLAGVRICKEKLKSRLEVLTDLTFVDCRIEISHLLVILSRCPALLNLRLRLVVEEHEVELYQKKLADSFFLLNRNPLLTPGNTKIEFTI
jgi:hypothetical protein